MSPEPKTPDPQNSAVTVSPSAGPTILLPNTHAQELQDLLVKKASKELGRPVSVFISQRRQLDNWVFLIGKPQELDGTPLDYQSTSYAPQLEEAILDDVLLALAHRSDDRWEIFGFSLGATDAPFFDWSDQFNVPLPLFIDKNLD